MKANATDRLRSNLRFARFIATSAYIAQYKLRAGQNLGPGLLLERHAQKRPDATALFFENERYDYRSFDARANQMAHALRSLGAKPGDVVAVLLDNRPELLFAVAGANKIGVCCAMINTSVVGAQLEHVVAIAKPAFVLVGAEHVGKLAAIAEKVAVAPERVLVLDDRAERAAEGAYPGSRSLDAALVSASTGSPGTTSAQSIENPCVYIYTSGTTGLPKAAAMKNGRFLKAASLFSSAVLRLTADDVLYGSGLPLYHSSGLILGWGSALVAGAAYGLRRKFSASGHWDDIARWNATAFTYIGELCRYLLNAPPHAKERGHRLRAIVGAGMRPDIWERFQERFDVPVVYEFYGATEGNVGIVNVDGRPGMMGRLLPGQTVVRADSATGELVREGGRATKVAVGEVGLLLGQINKMSSFDGYVDRSKNDSKVVRDAFGDGKDYFNTGDLVQLHPDGYVSFRDRTGDTFRWKGENVSTNEVQETLNRCPGVLESNVYGVEVPGCDGRAGMVALDVEEGFDVGRFGEHVQSSLPTYARPLFVRVQPQIAKTGTFKQVKTELREQGADPSRVADSLYFFEEGARYVPMTQELYATITSGLVRL